MHYFSKLVFLLILLQIQAKPNQHGERSSIIGKKQLASRRTEINSTDKVLVPHHRYADLNYLTWPGGIVYYRFDDDYPPNAREMKVKKAMKYIEYETCIKFVEATDDDQRYIEILDEGKCASTIGYVSQTNVQMRMYLNARYCTKGMIYHELLHVLGFNHEHTRPDRDEKINILWENVDNVDFFKKIPMPGKINLPYDYHSIMHVKANAYSKTGSETIQPLFNGLEVIMGQRTTLTTMDIVKINRLYHCTKKYQGIDLWPVK